MEEQPKSFGLGRDSAWSLWMGALLGTPQLALELEELGISTEEDSLTDARELRPEILAEMDKVVGEDA